MAKPAPPKTKHKVMNSIEFMTLECVRRILTRGILSQISAADHPVGSGNVFVVFEKFFFTERPIDIKFPSRFDL
jgi:hypothetical protein